MCDLAELTQDGHDEYTVCGGTFHAFVAELVFMTYDFIVLTSALAGIWLTHNSWPDDVTVYLIWPTVLLVAAWVTFFVGPVAVISEKVQLKGYYQCRNNIIVLCCLISAQIYYALVKGASGTGMALLWFGVALYYTAGSYYSMKSIDYFETRYAGFDDSDVHIREAIQGTRRDDNAKTDSEAYGL